MPIAINCAHFYKRIPANADKNADVRPHNDWQNSCFAAKKRKKKITQSINEKVPEGISCRITPDFALKLIAQYQ